jgi:hypothetical protein
VAIILSFFLAAFGSCRRWSNRWIVQKGFFAAHALSLSLGTYSIGLMQSSSVKSEMYPIWTVSLFTLFVCIDPVTAYNGHDYKGPLSKMAFGICLNFGYVLLMSISTTSNDVGRVSIIMLAAITFIKGFHRSLALAQQSRMRKMLLEANHKHGRVDVLRYHYSTLLEGTIIRLQCIDHPGDSPGLVSLDEVDMLFKEKEDELLSSCYNVCVALCLSQDMQQHFLGLGYGTRKPDPSALKDIDYKWALTVIEIELAFVFEVFFTGNSFFHYYQAKTSSLWALASFIGICFVGVATAIPAGTMRRTNNHISIGAGGCTKTVHTTTADLVMTFFILVSLGMLQSMHLIRCWTSNWARVAIACAYAKNHRNETFGGHKTPFWWAWWMRLKALVATSTNWFDKKLWQNKIGQYSMLPEGRLIDKEEEKGEERCTSPEYRKGSVYWKCVDLCTCVYKTFGVDYIWQVLWDLLGNDTNKKGAVRLDDEVKESVVDFLGKVQTDILDEIWFPSSLNHPTIKCCFPYSDSENVTIRRQSHGYRYARCVMLWHAVTWLCELAEQEQENQDDAGAGCLKKAAAERRDEKNRNRRVANALSKYCVHLVVSAPELLPGPVSETMKAYKEFVGLRRRELLEDKNTILVAMSDPKIWTDLECNFSDLFDSDNRWSPTDVVLCGVALAKELLGDHPPLHGATRYYDPWETLMHVWVRLLVYAAPLGNMEAHMRRLAQGGEFITHIWALLYHIDICEWKILVKEKNLHLVATAEDLEMLKKNDHATVIGMFCWVWTLSFSSSHYGTC